jgi:hypothetical protein
MADNQDSDTQDVAQRLLAGERLSIRAVLTEAGENPLPLLRAAGITEFLSVPVAMDADIGTAAAFGDGRGSSITATWEPDQAEERDDSPTDAGAQGDGASAGRSDSHAQVRRRAVNLPGAFGLRPVAPIDRTS